MSQTDFLKNLLNCRIGGRVRMVGDSISQESPQSAPTSKSTPYDPPSGELEAAIAEAHHALVETLDDDLTLIGRRIPWRYSHHLEPLITAQSIRHKRAAIEKAE